MLNFIYECSLIIYRIFEEAPEMVQDKYIKFRKSESRNDKRSTFIHNYLSPVWKEAMQGCLERLRNKIDSDELS